MYCVFQVHCGRKRQQRLIITSFLQFFHFSMGSQLISFCKTIPVLDWVIHYCIFPFQALYSRSDALFFIHLGPVQC